MPLLNFWDRYQRWAVIVFFLSFLFVGLRIFPDYGVHWDEWNNEQFGEQWCQYVSNVISQGSLHTIPEVQPVNHDWVHGPVFEVTLAMIQKILNVQDLPRMVFLRHACVFLLFFLGLMFFYGLAKRFFGSWKLGLLACLFLVFMPRIFADAFYNSVDLPFLSLFTISIYTMIRFFERRTLPFALVHASVCAFLIDVRFAGILMLFLTGLFAIPSLVRKEMRPSIMLVFFVVAGAAVVLFWPLLWVHPVERFLTVLTEMKRFHWSKTDLYFGKLLTPDQMPWHYALVWIWITTPVLTGLLFLIGSGFAASACFRGSALPAEKRNFAIVLAWFFLPLALASGHLFNGWRHLYFVTPALALLAVVGWRSVWRAIGSMFHGVSRRILLGIVLLVTALHFGCVFGFMVKYHPLQNLYFNEIAGRDMAWVKRNFELDYWGLSYRPALEYIAKHDPRKNIRVFVLTTSGTQNLAMLPPQDAARLNLISPLDDSVEYFVTSYKWHPEEYLLENEAYSFKIGNAKVISVYKKSEDSGGKRASRES